MLIKQFISDSTVHRLLFFYVIAMLMLDIGGGDLWLASKLYAAEGYQWSLQQHWFTEDVLHKSARQLNYVCCTVVLLLTLYFNTQRARYRQLANSLIALSLSLLSAFAVVAYLKAITNVACPRDLTLFGGTEPYIHLLQRRPAYLPYEQCFPAGHASVGYAWVALFYFFSQVRPKWRTIGLMVGLITGLVLGTAQQLRGAHFLSHDVTTLLLCLLCAKLCFMLMCKMPSVTKDRQL